MRDGAVRNALTPDIKILITFTTGYLTVETITYMNPLLTAEQAKVSMKPMIDLLSSFGSATLINTLSNVPSFYWFEHNYSGPVWFYSTLV